MISSMENITRNWYCSMSSSATKGSYARGAREAVKRQTGTLLVVACKRQRWELIKNSRNINSEEESGLRLWTQCQQRERIPTHRRHLCYYAWSVYSDAHGIQSQRKELMNF